MFIRTFAFVIVRVNGLSEEKEKKSITAFVIERSVELLGCTPDEKSDENLKWMRENGYRIQRVHKRGRRRSKPSKTELFQTARG